MTEPTDTNQASELHELCKKVYELTGWIVSEYPNDWYMQQRVRGRAALAKAHPLYTSDYLLEKLPGLLDIDNKTFSLAVQTQVAPPDFVALFTHTSVVAGKLAGHSTRYINVADTPLKALLKLTIALSEAGELK